MDRVATNRAAAPSALGMNEPLNAPLGSVEDELRFALGGDVDVQLFDGDIDEALRSAAAGGDDDGSVVDPFADGLSRSSSLQSLHGAGDCGSSPLGFPHRDPFQSDERYGHAAPAAAASDQPYLGLSRLVSMPGDDGCDGPTYVPLDDAVPGARGNMDPLSVPVQSELDYELAAAALQLRQFIFGGDPYAAPKGQCGAPVPTYMYPAPPLPEINYHQAYQDRFCCDVGHQLDSTAPKEAPDKAKKEEEEEAAPNAPPLGPAPPAGERQRLARSRRRRLRARYQVINKLGGNLREIRRRAVADSKVCSRSPGPGRWTTLVIDGTLWYNTSQTPAPGQDELLRSFAAGLDTAS
ncbi:hypothetical protein THAOC_04310, partial [Thalassiosira oceanica]